MLHEIRSTGMPPVLPGRPQTALSPVPQDGFTESTTPLRLVKPGLVKRGIARTSGLLSTLGKVALAPAYMAAFYPAGTLGALRAAGSRTLFGSHFIKELENHPKGFKELSTLLIGKANDPVEKSFGLAMGDLLGVEGRMFRMMMPVREDGRSMPSPLMRRLAELRHDRPQAIVDLGPERQEDSRWLEQQVSVLRNVRPEDVPELMENMVPAGDRRRDLGPVLAYLLERSQKNEPMVYIDLDGKLGPPNATEGIANQTVASIFRQDWSKTETARYFKWLNTRLTSYSSQLAPWIEKNQPMAHLDAKTIKGLLSPPWDRGQDDPLGWRIPPKNAQQALELLKRHEDPESLTDLVVSLDRDLVSGAQSYWVRLLRELGPEQRQEALSRVAGAFGALQARPVASPAQHRDALFHGSRHVSIPEFERETGTFSAKVYDRCEALTDVVDRTLSGLGIGQRKEFIQQLRGRLSERSDALEERDLRLQGDFGYTGTDMRALLSDLVSPTDSGLSLALRQLRAAEQSCQGLVGVNDDWRLRAADLTRHRSLVEWLGTLSERYADPAFRLAPHHQGTYAVSEFYPQLDVRVQPVDAPRRTRLLGQPDGHPPLRTSVVIEGGGGKGFAYPEVMTQIEESLSHRPGQIEIDEFVGTSAGALTAGLMAAGFEGEELKKTMGELNFMQFNSDFFQLQSGDDPKVRGIDRTGMFSMQAMYKQMHKLLADKLGLHQRPITFRDLPYDLKIVSTVVSTDLPKDHPLREKIGPDGSIVFSRQNTPDFDVVGCMLASAAVPIYFNSPQMHLSEWGADGLQHNYRMQFTDGGVANNLPLGVAGSGPDDSTCAVVMPVYYETEESRLSTLSFDNSQTGPIDQLNREFCQRSLPNFSSFLGAVRDKKFERLVLGLNLSLPDEQPAPIVQGSRRAVSRELVEAACQAGMPCMDPGDAQDIIKDNLPHRSVGSELVGQFAADWLADGRGDQNRFVSGLLTNRQYHPSLREVTGTADLIGAVMASKLTAEHHWKGFERLRLG